MEKMAAVGTTRIEVHFYEQLWIYSFHMSEEGDFVMNGKDTSSNNPETVEKQTIKRQNEGKRKTGTYSEST